MKIENENENLINLSYSKISDFDRNGPQALIRKSENFNSGIKIGSIIDEYVYNRENFFNKYFISKSPKPKGQFLILSEIIIERFKEYPSLEDLCNIVKEFNLFANIKKEDVLINHLNNVEFLNYLKEYYENSNEKIFINQDEYNEAKLANVVLKSSENSKAYFDKKIDIYNGIKFSVKYKKFNFIGVIDQLNIDHKNKTVQTIDLKTGKGSCKAFFKSFLDYRYYFQSSIYSLAKEEILDFFKIQDYTFLPFKFLYYSISENKTAVFTVKDDSIFFKDFKINNNEIRKGIDTVLDEIDWHIQNQIFDQTKIDYELKGEYDLIKEIGISEV